MAEKTCFVVMGFGEKPDFRTGRVLDLNKSYRLIIKPAVEAAGLKCIRADEIVHSGVIDVPMYRHLLSADLVIADLSTANANAFYELGVRHALRPFSTITIAESQLIYPFDVNHTVIRTYEHLGKALDYEEVERFRAVLIEAIKTILHNAETDSPVYTHLHGLKPPATYLAELAREAPAAFSPGEQTISVLMEQVEAARKKGDFQKAKDLLYALRAMKPEDPYLIQQLALVTYKSEKPTRKQALEEARELLERLTPLTSNDTETLGLWGAVHKRLWEETGQREYLDEAIFAHEKGFYLRSDYYNGINLAYLLNLRSTLGQPAEAIADFVLAERVRPQVLKICEAELETTRSEQGKYWILATMAECWLGLGDKRKSQEFLDQAFKLASESWMKDSTGAQLAKLETLLKESPLRHLAYRDSAS